jgi:phosphoesterase RecJ-like protein
MGKTVVFDKNGLDAFLKAIRRGEPVLVSTHIHPDPDAIGSALAMREMLLALDADPHVILQDPVPHRCKFLPGSEEVLAPSSAPRKSYAAAVIVDAGGLSRIGDVEALLAPGAFIVNIDHHLSNDRFGAVNFVDLESAATAEVLFLLCREVNVRITTSMANNLLAGLLTDTGRFRYSNTTGRSLRMAAELADAGAEITAVTDAMYFDVAAEDIPALSRVYSTLEFFGNGRISTLFARLDSLVEDPDTVVDLAASIRGVRVAALLSETPEGIKIRVSLRSRSAVNVAQVAESFGGGGHAKAAGFRMTGNLVGVRDTLVKALLAILDSEKVEDVQRAPA